VYIKYYKIIENIRKSMEFRNWFEFEEILCDYLEVARDTSILPLDKVNLTSFFDNRGQANYVSKFKIGEDDYTVDIKSLQNKKFIGKILEKVYDISFHGPTGFLTANKNNPGVAKSVYDHVLASVVKMVDVEKNVQGFVFTPAESKMALMYRKFYKDYLKPAGYLRVNSQLYLKKPYIRQLMSGLSGPDKKNVLGQIADNNKEADKGINDARKEKMVDRAATAFLNKMVNRIVAFNGVDHASNSMKQVVGFIVAVGPPLSFTNFVKMFVLKDKKLNMIDVHHNDIIRNTSIKGEFPKFKLTAAPTKSQIDEVLHAIENIKATGVSIPLPSGMATMRGISHPTNAAAYSRNFEEVLKTYKPSGPFSTWLQNEPSKSLEVVA
jgi:hypothetical protein